MTQALSPLVRAGVVAAIVVGMPTFGTSWSLAQEADEIEQDILNREVQAEQLVQRLQNLVLSQQRQLARELIERYPDTDLAQRARDLLEQLDLYDKLEAAQFSLDLARTDWVRNFWDARRPAPPIVIDVDMVITNGADRAAIFQVRGPGVEWSRPVVLTPGESLRLKYPAEYRQATPEASYAHLLNLGESYVFLIGPSDARPRLYRAN